MSFFVTNQCGEVSNSPVSFLWIVGFFPPVENENLKVSSLAVVFVLPLADMVLAPQNSSTIFSLFACSSPALAGQWYQLFSIAWC